MACDVILPGYRAGGVRLAEPRPSSVLESTCFD